VARDTAYRELADRLVTEITAGRHEVGARLPTDAELCATTGLSRGTVRRALGLVSDLGLISRRPGIGSQVLTTTPLDDYQPVARSTDDIAVVSRRTRLESPVVREVVAGAAVARRLGARRGSRWNVIEGLRIRTVGDTTPLCWSQHFVRPDTPGVEVILRGNYTDAEAAAGEIEQIVRAEPLDRQIASRLATAATAALVVMRRRRDERGRLLSVSIHMHPSDRYELRTVVRTREEST
jgi:GntR family transcriptional regulator